MIDRFKEQSLYPDYDQTFLAHFKGIFDEVFICFSPFFKLSVGADEDNTFSKSIEISLEELRKRDQTFKKVEAKGATIYARNLAYPKMQEILAHGTIVPWAGVSNNAGLNGNSELYKALKTSIGAYNSNFSRPDLAKQLQDFVEEAKIWKPGEGEFDVLTLKKIYNSFISLNKTEIIVEDEFHETYTAYDLGKLTVEKFIESIGGKDYYIYSKDKTILFSVDWDSFYFIICSTSAIIEKIVADQHFEGFLADIFTTPCWEHKQI